MDIESSELNVLRGASKTIIRDKLKIAIYVYHKDDDAVAIGDYVLSIIPDSIIYIRHYTPDYGETVMYFRTN